MGEMTDLTTPTTSEAAKDAFRVREYRKALVRMEQRTPRGVRGIWLKQLVEELTEIEEAVR